MNQNQTFLGIPIDGEITRGDKRVPQRPIEELAPLLRAVVDDPTMHSFGWTQYTPYFNDGEPCIFGVNTPWFRTVDDVNGPAKAERKKRRDAGIAALREAVEAGAMSRHLLDQAEAEAEEEDEEGDVDYDDNYGFELSSYGKGHPSLGKRDSVYNLTTRSHDVGPYTGPDEARYHRVAALDAAIQGGAFEDVLLDSFGDHASVTVRCSGNGDKGLFGISVERYDHD